MIRDKSYCIERFNRRARRYKRVFAGKSTGTNRLCKLCHCCCDNSLWPAILPYLLHRRLFHLSLDRSPRCRAGKRCQIGLCRCMRPHFGFIAGAMIIGAFVANVRVVARSSAPLCRARHQTCRCWNSNNQIGLRASQICPISASSVSEKRSE